MMTTAKSRTCVLLIALIAGSATGAVAQVDLEVDSGGASGDVLLRWSGGNPDYQVYRAAEPGGLVQPANLVGETRDRTFADSPGPGNVWFYRVGHTSNCFPAVADAGVWSNNPDLNVGTDPSITVQGGVAEGRALLRFNITGIPRGSHIEWAEIEADLLGWGSHANVELYLVDDEWDEQTVTWNTQPSIGAQASSNLSAPQAGWRRFDVRGLVQDWSGGTVLPFGVMLLPTADGATMADFASRESASGRAPRLCVEWKEPLAAGIDGLFRASETAPRIMRLEGDRVAYAEFRIPVVGGTGDDPVVQAQRFLYEHGLAFGLTDPVAELYLDRVDVRGDRTWVTFAQRHPEQNLPLFGADISVLLEDDGFGDRHAIGASGQWRKELPAVQMADVSRREAESRAAEHLGYQAYEIFADTRLTWLAPEILSREGAEPRLTWVVGVTGTDPGTEEIGRWSVFVDAGTAEVLSSYSRYETTHPSNPQHNVRNAASYASANCWTPPAAQIGITWFTWDGNTNAYDPSHPTNPTPDLYEDGEDTHFFARHAYNYAYQNFDYRGWDDQDRLSLMFVHVPSAGGPFATRHSAGCNALFFTDAMGLGDVVAHEWMHALDRFTDGDEGLIYSNQSGALDEAFADVFGMMLDKGDWDLGEDREDGGNPIRRDVCNRAVSHISQCCQVTGDNGGVHTDSGIFTKAFCLLVDGGTHYGVDVDPIGWERSERLFWDVHINRNIGASSTMPNARDHMVAQARDFRAERSPPPNRSEWTDIEVCAVINAFSAVGLGDPDGDCDGEEDPPDLDSDLDGVFNNGPDNCLHASNPSQSDIDGDGTGDACDTDKDGDGIDNADDNCAEDPNQNQADSDNDSIGNVCEDYDGDGVYDGVPDNCRYTPNPDQDDLDDDKIGDDCDNDIDGDDVSNVNDNCPWFASIGQEDGDADTVGDACDNCDFHSNVDQADLDHDDVGDVCDPDIDGDGLQNQDDPCPYHYTGTIFDFDGDGQSVECDDDDAELLNGFIDENRLIHVFSFDDPQQPMDLPVFPCRGEICPDWLDPATRTEVTVIVQPPLAAWIVDDRGNAHESPGYDDTGNYRFEFSPDLDTRYLSPARGEVPYTGAAADMVYEGHRYFLRLAAPEGTAPGTEVQIEVQVRTTPR